MKVRPSLTVQLISCHTVCVRPAVSVIVSVAEKQLVLAQIKEHRVAVLDLIEMYLKGEFINVVIHLTSLN